MKKHSFDMTSFLFGLVLGVAALGLPARPAALVGRRWPWALLTVLIVLGIAGIAGAIGGFSLEDSSTAEASTSEPLADQDEDADFGDPADHADVNLTPRRPTPDARRPTPDARRPTPDARRPTLRRGELQPARGTGVSVNVRASSRGTQVGESELPSASTTVSGPSLSTESR